MPPPPSLTFLRTFSTSRPPKPKHDIIKRLSSPKISSVIPPYPYGESRWYKQSNFGLYGLQKIRFGNNVSDRTKTKSRRSWLPNVHSKRLWSYALDRYVRVRITTRVLRTVDKCGGLDEYILGEKPARVKELGVGGWRLRWRIMQTEVVKERYRRQRVGLGLLSEGGAVAEDGVDELRDGIVGEDVAEEIRMYDEELDKELDVEVGDEVAEVRPFMEEESKDERKARL